MSLSGALNVGRSALAVHQAAIQVTGNNIANAGNADFTRQTAAVTPGRDQQIKSGIFVGTGINLSAVQRQIDDALQGRLRASFSDNESAAATQQWLGRVESVFNELGDDDLSSRLSKFFASWSNLANRPQDTGLRQVVLQEGDALARSFNDLRGRLGGLQSDVDDRLVAQVKDADGLATQLADLNTEIATAEGGGQGQANGLRDQRDAVLNRLSELIDVRTVQQDNGTLSVYIGSEPLVIGGDSRGLALKQEPVNDKIVSTVVIKATGGPPKLTSGQLAGLSDVRTNIDGVVDGIDSLAGNLIFQLNKLHASGQGLEGFASVTSTNVVDDPAAALNASGANLKATPTNGSFVVHVRQKATGLVTSTLVQVDLDGQGGETSLNSLAGDLDAIAGMHASVSAGQLTVAADSDAVEVRFSQDSSGVLAALGVNTFYTGHNAEDIAVNQVVKAQPALLAAARNGEPGDNQTARSIASLETLPLASLQGSTLKDTYQSVVNSVGVTAARAASDAEAASVVKDTLVSQREALSGVSLDEEAINLMRQQRAFQGAAKLVAAVDELMKVVLNMV